MNRSAYLRRAAIGLGAVALGIVPSPAEAQVTVRHNLDLKGAVAKPAFMTITVPQDAEESLEIGLGVVATVWDRSTASVALKAEHLRNTRTDVEQNHTRVGAGLELNFGDLSREPVHFFSIDGLYRNDGILDLEGAQIGAMYRLVGQNNSWLPNASSDLGGFGRLVYAPALGLQLDWILAADEDEAEGAILRGVFELGISIFPLSRQTGDRIEVQTSYAFRGDLSDGTDEVDDSHPWGSIGLNIWAVNDGTKRFGLQAAFVDGEDPTKGFQSQEFWRIGVAGSISP